MCVFDSAEVCNVDSTDGGIADAAIDTDASIRQVELKVDIKKSGRVTDGANGIDCDDKCSYMLGEGTMVELVASPASTFIKWSKGPCRDSTDIVCVAQLRAPTTDVKADFQ